MQQLCFLAAKHCWHRSVDSLFAAFTKLSSGVDNGMSDFTNYCIVTAINDPLIHIRAVHASSYMEENKIVVMCLLLV